PTPGAGGGPGADGPLGGPDGVGSGGVVGRLRRRARETPLRGTQPPADLPRAGLRRVPGQPEGQEAAAGPYPLPRPYGDGGGPYDGRHEGGRTAGGGDDGARPDAGRGTALGGDGPAQGDGFPRGGESGALNSGGLTRADSGPYGADGHPHGGAGTVEGGRPWGGRPSDTDGGGPARGDGHRSAGGGERGQSWDGGGPYGEGPPRGSGGGSGDDPGPWGAHGAGDARGIAAARDSGLAPGSGGAPGDSGLTHGGGFLFGAHSAVREPAAPEPAAAPRRRGIGAWARRLAGGRAAADDWPGAPGGVERTAAEAAALHERWPDPATVLMAALGPGPRLWERGAGHPDALAVRLGSVDRTAPDGGPLPAVPVTVGLRGAGSLGLAGPRGRLAGLARSVVAQLAALHSPTDLEIVLISTDRARSAGERLAEWSWLGWLPHARPARGQDCRMLLAYDRDQAAARAAELVRRLDESELGPDWVTAPPAAVADAAARYAGPYTVVVLDGDPGSAALRGTVSGLAARGAAAGIHLVCLAEAPAASPASPLSASFEAACAASAAFAECGAVALLSGDVATGLQVVRRDRGAPGVPPAAPGVVAAVDGVSPAWAERFARALAPLLPVGAADGSGPVRPAGLALPESARLLEELGLARATPASLLTRWAATADDVPAGGRALAVLGAGPRGPLAVDLAADGPHLVVDGAPGTGKTELLRAAAASLCAADRPDRLALVLVDGGGAERGNGLAACTDLPHVSTYLAASDPARMREFAQALSAELKRRAELLGDEDVTEWHARHLGARDGAQALARVVAPRWPADAGPAPDTVGADTMGAGTMGAGTTGVGVPGAGLAGPDAPDGGAPGAGAASGPGPRGDLAAAAGGTLRLRTLRGGPAGPDPAGQAAEQPGGRREAARKAAPDAAAHAPLPRLVVLVDDFDALVAPALGSPGRPAAGSVVRALEAVARDGARLGVHLVAASGRPERTEDTAAAERAGLRITLDPRLAPPGAAAPPAAASGPEAGPGRGRLLRVADGTATPFQAGRVTGRIPRTATQRPTVVPLDWERMGDPPTRRPVRELGNGPTDLALLASALQRAAQSAGALPAPPLL
ncbi:FtsK/SpoIIIE domain-containing protein, partial [Streptomyces sp. B1866]|uniref:FtsK/SpoIIIE domain-containing protein n=1 Tax=Streptomyces sp. B1866 TaxID=3075431 RepID=UPI00288FC680